MNDKKFLEACNRPGITIASLALEFNISPATVVRNRGRLKSLGFDVPPLHGSGRKEADRPYIPPVKPWDIVKEHFGFARVKRCSKRGYLLDGRPVTIQHLMKEAGAI